MARWHHNHEDNNILFYKYKSISFMAWLDTAHPLQKKAKNKISSKMASLNSQARQIRYWALSRWLSEKLLNSCRTTVPRVSRSNTLCGQERKNEVRGRARRARVRDIGLLGVKRQRTVMPGVIKTEVWRADFSGIAEINREHLDFFSMCVAGLAIGQRLSAHTEACVSNVGRQINAACRLITKAELLK